MTDFSKTHIQFRRGSAAEFTAANPILGSGEPGFAMDTKSLRIGDAVNTWSNLPSMIISDTAGIAGASGVYNIIYMSSGDYAALPSPDPNTIYFLRS